MLSTKFAARLLTSSPWCSGSCHQVVSPVLMVNIEVNRRRGFHSSLFPNLKRRPLRLPGGGDDKNDMAPMSGIKCRGLSGCGSSGIRFSSVKAEEVGKFERMSGSWWNDSAGGQMKELHSMNKLRVPFIRDGILQQQRNQTDTKSATGNVPMPLEGFRILDIGCGGGILCEPLGRLGATAKGIDPGQENITVASSHLCEDLARKVSYQCISIEDLALSAEENSKYDAVVMSEVIEHIENPEAFIRTATDVLKPGGSLFLTTLNRTMESWMGAIVAWEYLLRKLPVGTHDWKKFLTPQEMDRIFKSCGLRTVLIHGMCYNPLNNSWKWSNQRAINYAMHAVKVS